MHWELMKLRKETKTTKTDMCKLLGIKTLETYTLKEDGVTDFNLTEVFTIAKHFDKNIEEIFLPRNISNTDKIKEVIK